MIGRSVDFIEVKITSKKNFQKSVLRIEIKETHRC